ncbi:MAG TPA: K(+)-transporting ATPase subunit F [Chthoniobacterales bacterium]|nr:K(+)-transporting ATPase subunit F [Chthoniobacterales bacterium]
MRKSLAVAEIHIFMTNLIVGIIALGLIVYLIFTIIRPEKF